MPGIAVVPVSRVGVPDSLAPIALSIAPLVRQQSGAQRAPEKPISCVVALAHGAAPAPVGSSLRRPHRTALKELQMSAQTRTDSINRTACDGDRFVQTLMIRAA